MTSSNASQTNTADSVTHVTASAYGQWPVMYNLNKHGLSVLPAPTLEDLCLGTELTDAGWRIAEYFNTGLKILVRPTNPQPGGWPSRWLKAWGCYIVDLEAREIDTGVQYSPEVTRFTLVAKLGQPIKGRRFWTRDEQITNL